MRQSRGTSFSLETMHKEEVKFWLILMKEHTVFIRAGLPAEQQDLKDEAKEFSKAFASLSARVDRLKNQSKCETFYSETCEAVEAFYQYKRKLLSLKLSGKLNGFLFPYYLEHLAQEAGYFLRWLRDLKQEANKSQTREIVVWLRLMRDHTKLIGCYLDPSERRMRKMAADFADLFEDLTLEARDLAGMLYGHQGEVHAFRRFLQDARIDVQRLRDFNKMTQDLMEDGRLLSVLHKAMAAHMKRETEHCLMVIAMLEKGLIQHSDTTFADEAEEAAWMLKERTDEESPNNVNKTQEDDILYYAGVCPVETEDVYEPCSYEEEETEEIESRVPTAEKPTDGTPPKAAPDKTAEKPAVQMQVKKDLPTTEKAAALSVEPPGDLAALETSPALNSAAIEESAVKWMPRRAAGKTPSERIQDLSRGKNVKKSVLPRSLGKKKEG